MSKGNTDPRELMNRGGRQIAKRGIDRDAERAARAQAGNTDTVRWIPLNEIIIDEAIQVRVNGTDPSTVETYATVMFESGGWGPFPPVDLHRDGDKLYLSAGFHRVEAAVMASQMLEAETGEGIHEVPANIRPGGYAAAIEHAEEDNLTNALQLSNTDRKSIFEKRLARGHKWAKMSDRAVARELGVSYKTIGRWRRDIAEGATGTFVPVDQTTRISADGKVRDVSGIQKANQQRVQDEPRGAGVSNETGGAMELDRLKQRIVDTLAAGPLSPNRLRQSVGARDYATYNAALGALLADGAVVRDRDVQTSLVTYTLPSRETPLEHPADAAPEPVGQFEDQSQIRHGGGFEDAPEIAALLADLIGALNRVQDHLLEHPEIPEAFVDGVHDQIFDALELLEGYEDHHGDWVPGIQQRLDVWYQALGGS